MNCSKNFKKYILLLAAVIVGVTTARAQFALPGLGLPAPTKFTSLALPPVTTATNASCYFIAGQCSGPLPVQLLSFTATRINNQQAKLSWKTGHETGLTGYYIERSEQAAQGFTNKGFVAAAANGVGKKDYTTNDPNNLNITTFYRLRMVNTDGSIIYSEVQPVKPVKAAMALQVYPNPATAVINLRLTALKNTPATIIINDAAGKKIKEHTVLLQAGANNFTEQVSGFAGGSYFIIVKCTGQPNITAGFYKL